MNLTCSLFPSCCLFSFTWVIQNLPPVLFTLMKSTEPWSDDFYTFGVEAALQATGFEHQITVASDPRHCTIIGIKPSLS